MGGLNPADEAKGAPALSRRWPRRAHWAIPLAVSLLSGCLTSTAQLPSDAFSPYDSQSEALGHQEEGPAATVAHPPTEHVPGAVNEAFLFHLDHPPGGTFRFELSYEGAGNGPGVTGALLVAKSGVAQFHWSASSYWDYAYVGVGGTPVVHCCPQDGRWNGEKQASFHVKADLPSITALLMVAGWMPNEDARFRMWIEEEGTNVAHGLPLVRRTEEVARFDLRDAMRENGTVVVANGKTVVDSDGAVTLSVAPPHVTVASVFSQTGRIAFHLRNSTMEASSELLLASSGAGLVSADESLEVRVSALDRPYGMTGHVLTCSCAFPRDTATFFGAWTLDPPR